ncbi:hypothetical protein BHE74_00054781 [Ensete ventricosum]|nr:hypothetical protein GW17_00055234 [Ensete ventricosum]RWW39849.1 hypothetical protein BHE74_00054781 [Ensete ventricosum]
MRLGNSLEVRRELVEGVGSLPGWHKGVCRKKTETRRKIIGGRQKDFAEGIEKIVRNTLGDHRRRTMRLAVGNARGCWITGVRSLIKLGGHVWL